MLKRLPLKFQVIILSAISGSIPLLLTFLILQVNFMNFFEKRIEEQSMDIALQVSDNVNVKKAFSKLLPDKEILQQISNDLRKRTGAHVVFIDMMGTVLIQPYPSNSQLQIIGREKGRALKGESYTTKTVGESGRAIRAFVPLYNNNRQVGIVVAAFLEIDIRQILSQFYHSVYLSIPLAFLIIITLSIFLANSIKKHLFGMEPIEIATMLSERENILQSVDEGIIATDENQVIKVANLSASSLFSPDAKLVGEYINTLIPDSHLISAITTKTTEKNIQISINGKVLLSSIFPLLIQGKTVGTVIILKNLTEMNALAEELTGVQRIAQALRAKTHEFSNSLQVITGLIQIGFYDEVEKYVNNISAKRSSVSYLLNNIQINSIKGLLLGKASEADEKRISFHIDPDSFLLDLPDFFDENAMIIVLGNLIENAFEAVKDSGRKPKVFLSIIQDENSIKIIIKDNGPGIPYENQSVIFVPGFTTKPFGTGYGLANVKNKVTMAGGEITFTSDRKGTTFYVTILYDFLMD